jgi:hyperosmotically inducible periplasmic protein
MKRALTVALLLACGALTGCAAAVMASGGNDSRSATQLAADTALTADVKAKLLTDAGLKPLSISVNTYLGQVTLAGYVNNTAQRDLAGKLAGGVKGVKSVRNELTVK